MTSICEECEGKGFISEKIEGANSRYYHPTHTATVCAGCKGLGKTSFTVTLSANDALFIQEALYCWSNVLREGSEKIDSGGEFAETKKHLAGKSCRASQLGQGLLLRSAS